MRSIHVDFLKLIGAGENQARVEVKSAAERGLQVMITGAGGAAHLAGMVGAKAHLPVLSAHTSAILASRFNDH